MREGVDGNEGHGLSGEVFIGVGDRSGRSASAAHAGDSGLGAGAGALVLLPW